MHHVSGIGRVALGPKHKYQILIIHMYLVPVLRCSMLTLFQLRMLLTNIINKVLTKENVR